MLNPKEFAEFKIERAREFINIWRRYYHYEVKTCDGKDLIDYITELNLGSNLTSQNVKRLLRWKDPARLTENKMSGGNIGKKNDKVIRVIERLEAINDFRFNHMDQDDFLKLIHKIFRSGIAWRVFLFHIARPYEYPIADQNVFRSCAIHKNINIPHDWAGYSEYVRYFFEIATNAGIINEIPKGNEYNIKDIVYELKKLDEALFVFGKFLKRYGSVGYETKWG